MHDQEVLDTLEGPLHAYWTNADRGLLEINPKDWATNNGRDAGSCILLLSEPAAAISDNNCGAGSTGVSGGDQDNWMNKSSMAVETNGIYEQGDMSRMTYDKTGPYEPIWTSEEILDMAPKDENQVCIGSYFCKATWTNYLDRVE